MVLSRKTFSTSKHFFHIWKLQRRPFEEVARPLTTVPPSRSTGGIESEVNPTGSAKSSEASNETTDFGFRDVRAEEKEKLVRGVFSKVASNYDVMNDVMSFGAHRLWKDELVRMMGFEAAAKAAPDYVPRHLDVAGGTGDVAFRSLAELTKRYSYRLADLRELHDDDISYTHKSPGGYQQKSPIVVCDINPDMLAVGKQRAGQLFRPEDAALLSFIEGNAEQLPFPNESFDLYTIAFGLRNVTDKQRAIGEAHRVLRRGGRMLVLEFSHVRNPLVRSLYEQFSFGIIPRMGQAVAGDADSYQYLVESIRRFPTQEALRDMMEQGGFQYVRYTNFTFGVVAVHSGFKL